MIEAIAAQLGIPTEMVERSAKARATAAGVGVEQILAAWSGGEVPVPSAAAAPASPAPEAAAPAPVAPAAAQGPVVEVFEPTAGFLDDGDAAEEVVREPEVMTPRSVPSWLAATFVIIPALALLYALYVPNGPECGDAGQLAISPVTGEAESCDGSAYGIDAVNFFSMGEELYASQCSACHGGDGGGGAGPAFTGGAVLATFPGGQCLDHVEWVDLGSTGWPDATYGATNKAVGGSGAVMPAFGGKLSPEELASVVLYERVAFGGEALPDAEADCGLIEGAGPVAAGG